MNATSIKVKDEGRLIIATAAEERGWDDTRKTWLARAARRLGLSYSRVFNIWYGRARLYADELEEMRAAITEQKWRQRRHRERLDDQATQIQALARGPALEVERATARSERAGAAATAGAAARSDAEG